MFGNCRLRQWEFIHDVAAHPRLFLREHPQNPHPCRMGNRLRKGSQFVVGGRTFNRSCEQVDCWLLRWAAGRRFGLAGLSVRNGLGSHR